MSRQLIAAVCAGVGIASFAGCGGSGSSTATTSAKVLCPGVRTANRNYTEATTAMGVRFEDTVRLAASKKATESLLLRVEQLERATSGAQKRQLASLVAALSRQLKTFEAFENHNLAEVRKYGNSLNGVLREGLIELGRICPQPK